MENTPVKSLDKSASTRTRSRASTARTQLDPERWIDVAIDVLAKEGVTGLRIEVLAKRCGVTKGSFYWHFKDRQALLEAVLEHWKAGRIRDIEKTTAVTPGGEREQLLFAIDLYGANRNRKGMSIELAVRDWARHDPRAASFVGQLISTAWNALANCSWHPACRTPRPRVGVCCSTPASSACH